MCNNKRSKKTEPISIRNRITAAKLPRFKLFFSTEEQYIRLFVVPKVSKPYKVNTTKAAGRKI